MKVTTLKATDDAAAIIVQIGGTFGTYTRVFDAEKLTPEHVAQFLQWGELLETKLSTLRSLYQHGSNVIPFPTVVAVADVEEVPGE